MKLLDQVSLERLAAELNGASKRYNIDVRLESYSCKMVSEEKRQFKELCSRMQDKPDCDMQRLGSSQTLRGLWEMTGQAVDPETYTMSTMQDQSSPINNSLSPSSIVNRGKKRSRSNTTSSSEDGYPPSSPLSHKSTTSSLPLKELFCLMSTLNSCFGPEYDFLSARSDEFCLEPELWLIKHYISRFCSVYVDKYEDFSPQLWQSIEEEIVPSQCVIYREFNIVELLVGTYGAGVDAEDSDKHTPLHFAAKHPQKVTGSEIGCNRTVSEDHHVFDPIVEYLIGEGANKNCKDIALNEPLHYAASYGNYNTAYKLIRNGANLEGTDIQGMTPLLRATIRGRNSLVRLFLEKSANNNVQDIHRNNGIHLAVMSGDLGTLNEWLEIKPPRIVTELLEKINNKGDTPSLCVAANANHELIVRLLNSGVDHTAKNRRGQNFLFLVLKNLTALDLENISSSSLDVNAIDDQGQTLLFQAILSRNVMLVEKLINWDCDLEHRDDHSRTPILYAAKQGSLEMFNKLMERGAKVDVRDYQGDGVLAVCGDAHDILKKLLTREDIRGKINSRNFHGNTALHYAAFQGDETSIELLLEAGADPVVSNNEGDQPLHRAAFGGETRAMELLYERCKTFCVTNHGGSTPLHQAAGEGHLKCIQLILSKPEDHRAINMTTWNGQTALFEAVKSQHLDCVNELLKHAPDIQIVDQANWNVIFHACLRGKSEIVEALLENNADPTVRVSQEHDCYPNWNALNIAVERGHTKCIRVLCDSGFFYELMDNTFKNLNGEADTSFTHMIRKQPASARVVMTKCIRTPPQNMNLDYKCKLDFRFLIQKERLDDREPPRGNEDRGDIEMIVPAVEERNAMRGPMVIENPISLMLEDNCKDLLQHELVKCRITYEFIKVMALYMVNTLGYLLFLSFFTAFMLMTEAPHRILNNTHNCTTMQEDGEYAYKGAIHIPKYGTILLASLGLIKEMIQLNDYTGVYDFVENIMEMAIYVTSILVTMDFDSCMTNTGTRENWQWQTGSIGLYLVWLNLPLFMQNFVPFGIYPRIFKRVTINLCKMALIFSPIFIASGIVFYLLLGDEVVFHGIYIFPKISVMTTGETNFQEAIPKGNTVAPYPEVTSLVFVLFSFLVVICLMNMATGWAVGDVEKIRKQVSEELLRSAVTMLVKAKRSRIFKYGNKLTCNWFENIPFNYSYRPHNPKNVTDRLFNFVYKYSWEIECHDQTV